MRASQTPAEIVAKALADYGDPYPEQRAEGILLVLKGQGFTLVRHYRSTDPDGTPLRYCATCFEDWPCTSSPAEDWVAARERACQWCGRAIKPEAGAWAAVKGRERGYDPLMCDANDSERHEP